MHSIALLVCAILIPAQAPQAGAQVPATAPAKVHKVKVGGDGGWDYLTVDSGARRLYVSTSRTIPSSASCPTHRVSTESPSCVIWERVSRAMAEMGP